MLSDKMSIGANVYYDTLFFLSNDLGVDFSFRFYPWGGTGQVPEGLFFGSGVGFHMTWWSWFGYTSDWGTLYGGAITPDIGWRLDVGNRGGFFIEPGIKIPLIFGARKGYDWDDWYYDYDPDEWHFAFEWSFIPYIAFGVAF
jgi:hypothetical protein